MKDFSDMHGGTMCGSDQFKFLYKKMQNLKSVDGVKFGLKLPYLEALKTGVGKYGKKVVEDIA